MKSLKREFHSYWWSAFIFNAIFIPVILRRFVRVRFDNSLAEAGRNFSKDGGVFETVSLAFDIYLGGVDVTIFYILDVLQIVFAVFIFLLCKRYICYCVIGYNILLR